jgi:hypothetical protein
LSQRWLRGRQEQKRKEEQRDLAAIHLRAGV